MSMNSRTDSLNNVSAGAVGTNLAERDLSGAAEATSQSVPGKEGMILRSCRFLDLEAPPEFLNSWITPTPHFFVRNHMFEPNSLDAAEWRLNVGGAVDKPVSLSLADLGKLETHSVTNTLECAGNGRAFHKPQAPGAQWEKGAVGTARFSGPRLADVLKRAGVKSRGKHVMFRGLDDVPGELPPFIRSIPIEKAMQSDTLVATHMNGEPLSQHHGFPARALVPGWIGAASCKWLAEIRLLDSEFEGTFMKPEYRFPNRPLEPGGALHPDDTHAITALTVKSLITTPNDGASVKGRVLQVQGVAWAGEADIAKVDISTDAGASWHSAELGKEQARYAWRSWRYSWKAPKTGEYTILSRATDSQGRVQPESAAWNPSGYSYNAIDRVRVHIQG